MASLFLLRPCPTADRTARFELRAETINTETDGCPRAAEAGQTNWRRTPNGFRLQQQCLGIPFGLASSLTALIKRMVIKEWLSLDPLASHKRCEG